MLLSLPLGNFTETVGSISSYDNLGLCEWHYDLGFSLSLFLIIMFFIKD